MPLVLQIMREIVQYTCRLYVGIKECLFSCETFFSLHSAYPVSPSLLIFILYQLLLNVRLGTKASTPMHKYLNMAFAICFFSGRDRICERQIQTNLHWHV